MKQRNRKQFGISLKFVLLVALFLNFYFEAVAKESIGSKDMHYGDGVDFNDRMSKIETENQQLKTVVSLLKTVVEEDKKAIAILTIKLDEEHESVNHLKSHIERIEKSALNYSTTKETLQKTTNRKTHNKREAGKPATPKLTKNQCADSSRLCTFYYPDHPDAFSARNSSIVHNKYLINSDSFSNGRREMTNNQCSESSRLCTFAHPDHPKVPSSVNSTTSSNKQVSSLKNSSYNLNEPNALISGTPSSSQKDENDTGERFYGPPTNCSEIGKLGYTLNGYYLVKSSNPSIINKIAIAYCAFRQPKGLKSEQVLQTPIGNVEVKTRSVYFHARMIGSYSGGILPFKRRDINIGGAFNEWDLTAPVAGTYHFSFHGTVLNPGSDFQISTTINNYVQEYISIKCGNCSSHFLYIARTYHLNAGDRFWLYKSWRTSGTVGEGANFFGWLVQED